MLGTITVLGGVLLLLMVIIPVQFMLIDHFSGEEKDISALVCAVSLVPTITCFVGVFLHFLGAFIALTN
jgi:hypothetical protein